MSKLIKLDQWQSNAERRGMLKKAGWKPSVGMTVLTRIAHWTDGSYTLTEEQAAKAQAAREKELEP